MESVQQDAMSVEKNDQMAPIPQGIGLNTYGLTITHRGLYCHNIYLTSLKVSRALLLLTCWKQSMSWGKRFQAVAYKLTGVKDPKN